MTPPAVKLVKYGHFNLWEWFLESNLDLFLNNLISTSWMIMQLHAQSELKFTVTGRCVEEI